MNRRLAAQAELFTFSYNGQPITAVPGDTLASALLANGVDIFSRSIKYHRPRGAWCLAGRCSHCLVRVDGVPDLQACTTPAAAGLNVTAQNSYPSAKHDVLAAIDWMFPKGLDHHAMFAGVPVVEDAVAKVARHIAGIGPLPDAARGPDVPVEQRRTEFAVVGAGPAGLACALELAKAGRKVELVDERPRVGGRLLSALDEVPPDLAWAEQTATEFTSAGGQLSLQSTVLAIYKDEQPRLLAIRQRGPDRLSLLTAQKLVFCNGAIEPLEPFENNDLPGVYAGRGLARMLKLQQVLPGQQAVIVGSTSEALALARQFAAAGAEVAAIVDPSGALRSTEFRLIAGKPSRAHGRSAVKALDVLAQTGGEERIGCDLVAVLGMPSAAIELPRQAGAFIGYLREAGGYRVEAVEGKTTAEGVFAAGDVTGVGSAAQARQQGQALGRALAALAF